MIRGIINITRSAEYIMRAIKSYGYVSVVYDYLEMARLETGKG